MYSRHQCLIHRWKDCIAGCSGVSYISFRLSFLFISLSSLYYIPEMLIPNRIFPFWLKHEPQAWFDIYVYVVGSSSSALFWHMLTISIDMSIYYRYSEATTPGLNDKICSRPHWLWSASLDVRESAFLTWMALPSRYHTRKHTWHVEILSPLAFFPIWFRFATNRIHCRHSTQERFFLDARNGMFLHSSVAPHLYRNADYQKGSFPQIPFAI